MTHKHAWIVFSTAVSDGGCLMVRCQCGAYGTVNDPTPEEWRMAYFAPSCEYEWAGGDERVQIRSEFQKGA